MRVKELKGFKSLRALNAFHTLMLGLKMLPSYMSETYESFFARIDAMDEEGKRKMLKEAALFVELQKEEVEALVCFCTDKNGVSYGANNIDNLGLDELHSIIVEVCYEVSKIQIDFLSESEKKKYRTSAST